MGLSDIEAGDIFGDIADSAKSAASDAVSSATSAATQAAQSQIPGFGTSAPATISFRPQVVRAQAGPVLSAQLLGPTGRVVSSVPAFRPDRGVSLPMFQPAAAVAPSAPVFASSALAPGQTPAQSTNTLLLAAAALGAVYLLAK